MAAGQARRIDPTLAAKYHRLMTEAGKHHNSALCHIATTLLTRIIACWRAGQPYQLRDIDGTPVTIDQARAIIADRYAIPNGMVFTTRLSGGSLHGTQGRNSFEHELRRLGVTQKNSRPNHPTTCGKVERFQQTMKKWLASQPDQPTSIAALQALLDSFAEEYNHRRPHRSLPHRATPATAYTARPKATPGDRDERHPRPPPPRPGRQERQDHPSPRRPALLHRHRPNPHPNPRPHPRPGPRHPHHRRRHRRTPPRTHPRPHQALPSHRPPTRPNPLKQQTAEPTTIGFGRPGCPETSHACGRQDSNPRPLDPQ